MPRLTAADLPARYQAQLAAQMTAKAAPVPAKPRLRQKQGDGMNKTERAFLEHLNSQYGPPWIHSAQSITLRLANGVRFTPDFFSVCQHALNDVIVMSWETKGHMRDDAAVKLKVAASGYRWIKFNLVTKRKGGGWDIQQILP